MNKGRVFPMILVIAIAFSLMSGLPRQILAQTEKGIELYNSWQYKEAEQVLREAIKANPADIPANFYLGLSLLLEEKYGEALEIFSKVASGRLKAEPQAQSAIPDEFQMQIAMARAHLGLKQYPEAWKNLESAKKQHADAPDVYIYRGVYYLQQDKIREAIKELDKAVDMDEHNAYAHYYAGHAYLHTGNVARAVEFFKMFIQLAPMAPEVEKARALISALC